MQMKILVVCQHYWPEQYPLPEICENLVLHGYYVHIITGVPNYPSGYIFPEYRNRKNRHEMHNGVRITRTFTIGRRKNILFRLLNYFSFSISSTWYAMHLKEEYDIVFANQTSPIIMSLAAVSYAKKWKKKSVLYCLDLWPTSLRVAGIRETHPVYKAAKLISQRIYKAADTILVSSWGFRDYLHNEFGIEESRIFYQPQFAEDILASALPISQKENSIDLVFTGNIGMAQNLKVILGAATLLQDIDALRWHIVGDGQELKKLEALAEKRGLKSVIFHGRRPLEEMPAYYSMADAMIVCMTKDPQISLTLPHKVQTYMAAGKPILVSSDGEAARVVNESRCGFCAPADDPVAFANVVRSFLALPAEIKTKMGQNAQMYYSHHFSKEKFFERLLPHLTQPEINSQNTDPRAIVQPYDTLKGTRHEKSL